MALLMRVYLNAVFGALGGLLGWLLFGIFGDKQYSSIGQQLLGGALIGGLIGYLVVSVEAIRDRSLLRFCRLASYGVILGALGGAPGNVVGEQVNYQLVQGLLSAPSLRSVGEIFSRGLGWMFLGLAIGLGEGIAARSLGKLSYGTLGGAIGGLVGGALFGLLKELEKGSPGSSHVWGGAMGLVILGACIGGLSALVQAVFQPASVRVLRGWQEGREYPLLKAESSLGRDEAVDIPLFRDMRVEKHHALIQRDGNRFILHNRQAPPDQTRVNDEPVPSHRDLRDGDRIQLGNIVLRFQMRSPSLRHPVPTSP
ncbi:MAG TPA: FHA domain-containing protein [Gemmataceae bacterium]|nr:FHA domain-containing protein [Gemmataceae bacterium]